MSCLHLRPPVWDYSRPLLPTHMPVEGDDFMPAGWCGGCEHCCTLSVPIVCVACSYTADGQPSKPVHWEDCPVRPR